MDGHLSDHDMILKIYNALYEPETGLKSLITKNTNILWGDVSSKDGLVSRMAKIENNIDEHIKSHRRFYYYIVGLVAMTSTVIDLVTRLVWKR